MIRLTAVLIFALTAILMVYGQEPEQAVAAQPQVTEVINPVENNTTSETTETQTAAIIAPTLRPARTNTPHLIQITTTDAPEDVLLERTGNWYVTGERVNMRSGPSTQNRVVDSLTRGEAVNVIGFNGNWAHLQVLSNGQEGYMSRRYLSANQP
ncbi:SH3 domain-containing protein [Cochlodiniinecator piscidefendens]|uniref:SH3 domain-containing protein n=1 Tax=Cochlodiniinecator piscidefendens TaxID=2715756 RepID=UPI00140D673B|nr:SH3 domain-containing protein [Cochlodiniinecator piscidefendens]